MACYCQLEGEKWVCSLTVEQGTQMGDSVFSHPAKNWTGKYTGLNAGIVTGLPVQAWRSPAEFLCFVRSFLWKVKSCPRLSESAAAHCLSVNEAPSLRVWPLPNVATVWSPLELLCGAAASILSKSTIDERKKQPAQRVSSLLCTQPFFVEDFTTSANMARAWRTTLPSWWGDSSCLHRELGGCCSSSLHTSLPGPPPPV